MTPRQSRHFKKKFLESFRQHGNVSWAAREAKLPHRTVVYDWQEHDEQFAYDFRQAEIESVEVMEAEAYRRGVTGVEKPIFHQGLEVGKVREYSDVLLIFQLKARAPHKYRDNAQSGSDQPAVKAYADVDMDRV